MGVLLPGTVLVAGVMVALGAPVLAPAPSPPVDAVPVLTSTPFGAGPGQQVRHTITLSGSGTGTAAAVRVTFTTTVDLDGAAAGASPGRCAVTARTVVCDLGDLRFPADAAPPTITITGSVHPGTAPGALVQNRVSVDSARSATNPANEVVSNAYLVPGSSAKPTLPAEGAHAAAAGSRAARRPIARAPAVAAVLACGAVALGGLLLFRRLRQRRS